MHLKTDSTNTWLQCFTLASVSGHRPINFRIVRLNCVHPVQVTYCFIVPAVWCPINTLEQRTDCVSLDEAIGSLLKLPRRLQLAEDVITTLPLTRASSRTFNGVLQWFRRGSVTAVLGLFLLFLQKRATLEADTSQLQNMQNVLVISFLVRVIYPTLGTAQIRDIIRKCAHLADALLAIQHL